jgi:hypothetical protein
VETPREASHDAFIHRPPPTPAPSWAGSLRATHHQRHYLEQQIIARLSILILSKTYPSVTTTSPTLDMIGFLSIGFLLLRSNKEYVLTFKILAQVLVGLLISRLAIYYKHNVHQLPSLGSSWPVDYVVSDNGERPTIDWFITLQGGPKHTVGCPHEDNHQVVPKNPQVWIKCHSLWYRLSGIPHKTPKLTRAPPVASRETHPKSSGSEIPHRLIKVLGLPVPFPTSA